MDSISNIVGGMGLVVLALIFIGRLTSSKEREESFGLPDIDNLPTRVSFLLFLVIIPCLYLIRKFLELPEYFGFENPLYQAGSFEKIGLFVLYGCIILLTYVFFGKLVSTLSESVFSKIVLPQYEKFKKSKSWQDYLIYRDDLIRPSIGEMVLSQKATLKYSELDCFKMRLVESCDERYGSLIKNRLKNFIYVVFSFALYFLLFPIFYSGLFEGGVVFGYHDFLIINKSPIALSLREYWLFMVWLGGRLISIAFLFVVVDYLFVIWKLYKNTVISFDDNNFYYYKAEDAYDNGKYKTSNKYYKKLLRRLPSHGVLSLGEKYNIPVDKNYLESRITN